MVFYTRKNFFGNYPHLAHGSSEISARPVRNWRCLQNIGLKGRRIFNLPGAPTCIGPALYSASWIWVVCNFWTIKFIITETSARLNLFCVLWIAVLCISLPYVFMKCCSINYFYLYRVLHLAEALFYKPESRGFDFRWGIRNFWLT